MPSRKTRYFYTIFSDPSAVTYLSKFRSKKPLAEQFHVTRQWKGYETALFNRLLLAFDFNGNSMSFRGDTSVNGLDTLERFINDTKAKLGENIKALQSHEGTTELSQAIRDEKLKLLEGINGVAIGYKHWQGLRSADQWRKQGTT